MVDTVVAKKELKNRITISDVAKQASVSIGTVSAVINAHPTVSPRTRDHVLRIIKELNFRPKGHAQALKRHYSDKCIGLIVRKLDNPFYTALATGVKRYANKKGYLAFVSSSEGNHESEENISRVFVSKEVLGAIIAPVLDGIGEIDHLFRLKMLNFPFVILEEVPGIQANVVSINNSEAITEAVKYLIECGHTNILHFSGPENDYHAYERINAFRQAFSECHLIFRKDMIIPCGGNFEDGYKAGVDYFKNIDYQKFPIAVICFNDVVAMGLLSFLKKLNLNIPRQVAVIGIDDIEQARHWSPALTTIGTPLHELGEKAAEMLINMIESDEIPPVQKVILQAKLLIRETTCVLKKEPAQI